MKIARAVSEKVSYITGIFKPKYHMKAYLIGNSLFKLYTQKENKLNLKKYILLNVQRIFYLSFYTSKNYFFDEMKEVKQF